MLTANTDSGNGTFGDMNYGSGSGSYRCLATPAEAREASDKLHKLVTSRFQGIEGVAQTKAAGGFCLRVDLAHPVSYSQDDLVAAVGSLVIVNAPPTYSVPADLSFADRSATVTLVLYDEDILGGVKEPGKPGSSDRLNALKANMITEMRQSGFAEVALNEGRGWSIDLTTTIQQLEQLFDCRIGEGEGGAIGFVTAPRYPAAMCNRVKYMRFGSTRRLAASVA